MKAEAGLPSFLSHSPKWGQCLACIRPLWPHGLWSHPSYHNQWLDLWAGHRYSWKTEPGRIWLKWICFMQNKLCLLKVRSSGKRSNSLYNRPHATETGITWPQSQPLSKMLQEIRESISCFNQEMPVVSEKEIQVVQKPNKMRQTRKSIDCTARHVGPEL